MIKKIFTAAALTSALALGSVAQAADPLVTMYAESKEVANDMTILLTTVYMQSANKHFQKTDAALHIVSGISMNESNVCTFSITSSLGVRNGNTVTVDKDSRAFISVFQRIVSTPKECVDAYTKTAFNNFGDVSTFMKKNAVRL